MRRKTKQSRTSPSTLEEQKKDCKDKKKKKTKVFPNLNSWSFYQLQNMIEDKAKKYGMPVSRLG
jgi:IS605 OrfB family transposase